MRAQTVDYEKRVSGFVLANPELRFVCLVSDLYRPGYNPKESLEKDLNLARTATRYKVDLTKIAAAVRLELTKAKTKTKHETYSAKGRIPPTTQQSKALARGRTK